MDAGLMGWLFFNGLGSSVARKENQGCQVQGLGVGRSQDLSHSLSRYVEPRKVKVRGGLSWSQLALSRGSWLGSRRHCLRLWGIPSLRGPSLGVEAVELQVVSLLHEPTHSTTGRHVWLPVPVPGVVCHR